MTNVPKSSNKGKHLEIPSHAHNELQCVAARCSLLQSVAVWCNVRKSSNKGKYLQIPSHAHSVLQCFAACCNLLQCIAMYQVAATKATSRDPLSRTQCVAVCCSVLQCVAVCCSVLLRVAVCCSVLQCVVVCCSVPDSSNKGNVSRSNRTQTVCYSVLQCVAVCCSALQSIAVYCSELQCVAVCCSVPDSSHKRNISRSHRNQTVKRSVVFCRRVTAAVFRVT